MLIRGLRSETSIEILIVAGFLVLNTLGRGGILPLATMSLLPPNFVLQPVTTDDIVIASLALGFTIGFGWLTTWAAAQQTYRAYKRGGLDVFRNVYIWMIWLELMVCLSFSIICWLHLKGIIPPR